jgi:hypothetical protein
MNFASKKSIHRFIAYALRIIEAKPICYYHQTLSFPVLVTDTKAAKKDFLKFIKSTLKRYADNEMAIFYKQEQRKKDNSIHYHVCFLFFNAENLPFYQSRMRRDFRTDIFARWKKCATKGLFEPVHDANELNEHQYDLKSIEYFTNAVVVLDKPTKRTATNWWGVFNKHHILNRSVQPTRQQRQKAFSQLFRQKGRARQAVPEPSRVFLESQVLVNPAVENEIYPLTA